MVTTDAHHAWLSDADVKEALHPPPPPPRAGRLVIYASEWQQHARKLDNASSVQPLRGSRVPFSASMTHWLQRSTAASFALMQQLYVCKGYLKIFGAHLVNRVPDKHAIIGIRVVCQDTRVLLALPLDVAASVFDSHSPAVKRHKAFREHKCTGT